MNVQIVMNHTGDTRHTFDPASLDSVREAQQRFDGLTAKGFRAVALGTTDRSRALQDRFDPAVEETLFIPQLQGG